MSTRKRGRPSLNANDDVDELSPSKATSAPLSAVKKRKLNTYGSNKGRGLFGTLASVFSLSRSEKENVEAMEEKDELAHEEEEKEDDIWEVPDDNTGKGSKAARSTATPTTLENGNYSSHEKRQNGIISSKKSGTAKASKRDIYEVNSSEDDMTTMARSGRPSSVQRGAKHPPDPPESANKFGDEAEVGTPKRGRGRPPKQVDIIAPSAKKSPGKPRKSDILKKAKKLSREASFHAMVEAGRRAAEESESTQLLTRRRSGRANPWVETEEEAEYLIKEIDEAEATSVQGRPEKGGLQAFKDAPKGILTPTKNRSLKTRKSVAFEARDGIDLGFRDLPDSMSKASTLEKAQNLNESVLESADVLLRDPKKRVDSIDDTTQQDEDDVACAVCNGLESDKGNEMILCESCDFAVHLRCYGLPKVPKGDWLCRDCLPDDDDDLLTAEGDLNVALEEVFNDIPEIEGLEYHLQHMQRVLLDRLTGQKRITLRGHDEEMRKVHQVIEQTVLAGEGNSMLVIGARGCGKTTVSSFVLMLLYCG